MDNFLPILNSNKHYALLKDSVRTCVLEELAQVQRETDEDDTKYKHVATEVSGNMCTRVLVCLCACVLLV
jgi:ABC-type glutathione transport system ATPase component